jgi:hypothetical protein
MMIGALMLGLAACGGKNDPDYRSKGDTTDMTPAPTPSGYSDKTGTTSNTDSTGIGRNNPASSAAQGSNADTAGKNQGGIRNMGNDVSPASTIDTPRANSSR